MIKLYKKVRNENGSRDVYLFERKIFSYKKNINHIKSKTYNRIYYPIYNQDYL